MQKRHFEFMASMVRAILNGEWTNEWPIWVIADSNGKRQTGFVSPDTDSYTRAVQTAEAFILLAQAHNPLFDVNRFLIACGLASAPAKGKRSKACTFSTGGARCKDSDCVMCQGGKRS